MTERLATLRPVVTQPQHDFGLLLAKVLSPARPLQSPEFLKGRELQLEGIRKAFYQPGRHVLIHGLRGVGKSSLAQTAAYLLANEAGPIILSCDRRSTFSSVARELYEEALNRKPTIEKRVSEVGGGFSRFGIGVSGKVTTHEVAPTEPGSVNEAVRLVKFLCDQFGEDMLFVVDEFDQIESESEQEHFAMFIKQVSDRHVPAKFIFCGIGDSPEKIMAAHASADRYFHTVQLGQLPWEARFEIVESAAEQLGISVERGAVLRIGNISDGFPHYVHFIAEKLFWRVYEAQNNGHVSVELFEGAMSDAAASMDMKLRGPYETATQKYRNDYESVLWAAADGHEFKRRSTDIFESYQRIMAERREDALDRKTFNQRINVLKKPSHATILTGSRQGWYEFTEKMVRGYVRLRAEQNSVVLQSDYPEYNRLAWRPLIK